MIAGVIVGAGIILAIIGFMTLAKDKGWIVAWWHWLMMAIATITLFIGVGFLGTMISENTAAQGWAGLAIMTLVASVLVSVAIRTMRKA